MKNKKVIVLDYDLGTNSADELGKYFTRRVTQDGWEILGTYVLGLKLYVIYRVNA